jgi:UDP-arabinose 4-epimerase
MTGVDDRTVLVVGGAGYIGSHVCKLLAQRSFRPVVFDNLLTGHRWAVRWGPLVEGDIRDPASLGHAFAAHAPGAVMHFAAHASVAESIRDPLSYFDNNVAGTVSLLAQARRHGVQQFIFSSSCATFGIAQVPIGEDQPQAPINPYGASKLMVERILTDCGAAYGLRSVALRYFNAAGADPDGEIGEWHENETHLVPLVLDAAVGRRPAVFINGGDYDTPDGTCIRDYIHVSDLAEAHVRALEMLRGGGTSRNFNLGNGRGHSVNEVVAAARAVTGSNIPVVVRERRQGDPPRLVADPALAIRELGWRPCRGDIALQIGDAWRWHCQAVKRFERDERAQSVA